jgi:hypothetical protein
LQNLDKDNEVEKKINFEKKFEIIFKIISDLFTYSYEKDFNLKMLSEIFDFGSMLDSEYSKKFESFGIAQCKDQLAHERAEDLIRKYEMVSNLKN